MFSIVPILLIALPALLFLEVGLLIRKRADPQTVEPRTLLYLAWVSLGSLAALLASWVFQLPILRYASVLAPILPAMLTLTFLHLRAWNSLAARSKTAILTVLLLLALLAAGRLWFLLARADGRQYDPILAGLALTVVTACLHLAWTRGSRAPALFGASALLYLAVFNLLDWSALSLPSDAGPAWQAVLGGLAYLTVPGLTVAALAALTGSLFRVFPDQPATRLARIGQVALLPALLAAFGYTFVWFSLWDGTDDGIRWIILLAVAGIAAVSAATVIAMQASGWRRWIGVPFLVAVIAPLFFIGNFDFGRDARLSNYTVTEGRAARIQAAIESYKAETGRYPSSLADLAPGELWRVPLPMVIPGEGWCYDSGADFYRLGLVFREHWSSPKLAMRLYASAGEAPQPSWTCGGRLDELRARYDPAFAAPP